MEARVIITLVMFAFRPTTAAFLFPGAIVNGLLLADRNGTRTSRLSFLIGSVLRCGLWIWWNRSCGRHVSISLTVPVSIAMCFIQAIDLVKSTSRWRGTATPFVLTAAGGDIATSSRVIPGIAQVPRRWPGIASVKTIMSPMRRARMVKVIPDKFTGIGVLVTVVAIINSGCAMSWVAWIYYGRSGVAIRFCVSSTQRTSISLPLSVSGPLVIVWSG